MSSAEDRCAPAEPVPPEGVAMWLTRDGSTMVRLDGGGAQTPCACVCVNGDGRVVLLGNRVASAALLRYAADLADHLAAQHAAGGRERKLAAVKAAEEAYEETSVAVRVAKDAVSAAGAARIVARNALDAARKEAGL